jgi:CheY-like chemotaxis protein
MTSFADLHGVNVVVVDDDPDCLDLTTRTLRWCGAVVTAATDARRALDAAREVRPHVVITDIAMPGEDGYWLADQLRAAGIHVHVIAMSAFGSRNRMSGATPPQRFRLFLTKPVDPLTLSRVVRNVVGQPE